MAAEPRVRATRMLHSRLEAELGPSGAGGFQKPQEASKRTLPKSLKKGHGPVARFRLRDLRKYKRISVCCLRPLKLVIISYRWPLNTNTVRIKAKQ